MSPMNFGDVFGGVELSANVKTTLKNTKVNSVKFNKNTRLMDIVLSSDTIINEDCLDDFRLDIKEGFDCVTDAKIHLTYNSSLDSAKAVVDCYRDNLSKYLREHNKMCSSLFDSANCVIDGSNIIFEIGSRAAFLFNNKGYNVIFEQLLNEHLPNLQHEYNL